MDDLAFDRTDVDGLISRVLEKACVPAAPQAAERVERPKPAEPAAEGAWKLAGILGPTRVTTDFGNVPAHLVRVGDRLRTRSGAYARVDTITEIKLDEDFIVRHPEARPVRIRKNSLKMGTPIQDVCLSPAQMVGMSWDSSTRREIAAANVCSERLGIDRSLGMVAYYQFHLAAPALIHCEGIWVMSRGPRVFSE